MSTLIDAPAVAGRPWAGTLHVRQEERRAELRRVFAALQAERDAHEARCHARELAPNPCLALWSLDERLRATWTEIEFLGGAVEDLYRGLVCPPACPDCPAVTP